MRHLATCERGIAVALMVLSFSGCGHDTQVNVPPDQGAPRVSASEAASDFPGVVIDEAAARRLGLELAPVATSKSVATMQGMAVVLDGAALAAVLADLEAARAEAAATRDNFNRVQRLYADDGNASRQAVDTARTQWTTAHAHVSTLEARARSDWGVQLVDPMHPQSDLLRYLANGRDVLLRADFPEMLPSPASGLEYVLFGGTADEKAVRKLGYVGRSHAPTLTAGGDSVVLHLQSGADDTFSFRPGTRLAVTAGTSAGPSRPIVPAAAAFADGGQFWCYVARKAGRFDRVPLAAAGRVAGGYPVGDGVSEGDQVVVRGASLLLSLERGSGSVPDEG